MYNKSFGCRLNIPVSPRPHCTGLGKTVRGLFLVTVHGWCPMLSLDLAQQSMAVKRTEWPWAPLWDFTCLCGPGKPQFGLLYPDNQARAWDFGKSVLINRQHSSSMDFSFLTCEDGGRLSKHDKWVSVMSIYFALFGFWNVSGEFCVGFIMYLLETLV